MAVTANKIKGPGSPPHYTCTDLHEREGGNDEMACNTPAYFQSTTNDERSAIPLATRAHTNTYHLILFFRY